MSMPRKEKVKCPRCGKEIAFTVWDSINTQTLNAAEDVISGKLFTVECPRCGRTGLVDYPMIFNDLAGRVMIYYSTLGSETDVLGSAALMRGLGYRIRTVSTQADLREKVAVFHAGLDDRVTEIVKQFALAQWAGSLAGSDPEEMYYLPDGDCTQIEFVIGGESSFVGVSPEGYRFLEERFREQLEREPEAYIIDRVWAKEFLSRAYTPEREEMPSQKEEAE